MSSFFKPNESASSPPAGKTSFRKDERGGVALVFSLSIFPALMMVTLGVDYSAMQIKGSRVQTALDAAVLSGVNDIYAKTPEARIALAEKTFDAQIGDDAGLVTSKSFTVQPDGTLSARAVLKRDSLVFPRQVPAFTVARQSTALMPKPAGRSLDIAMCVDATGSMSNTLNAVKNNVANFKTNLNASLKAQGVEPFSIVRARVIYFKDYGGNGYGWGDPDPMRMSNFFNMDQPAEVAQYSAFVNSQWAWGGGDWAESGLECLWHAMNSPWLKKGDLYDGKTVTTVATVVSLYTDAPAQLPNHPNSVANPAYPAQMPRSYGHLKQQWDDPAVINQSSKSVLFYGNPDMSGWQPIKTWKGFNHAGPLTSANNDFITSLAKGIASSGSTRLIN